MRQLVVFMVSILAGSAFANDGNHQAAGKQSVKADECIIQEVIPGKKMTGAFVTFNNHGEHDAVLTSVAIPKLSQHVEMHEMKMENGVMKMQQIKEFTLKPGISQFKKGGYHIMVMDIPVLPKVGDTFQMEFDLRGGAHIDCQAKVWSVDDVMKHFGNNKMPMGKMDIKHKTVDHKNMEHKMGDMKH